MLCVPKELKKGDYIGVTATSGGLEDVSALIKLENATKNLVSLGFKVKETPNVRKREKIVSSSGKVRAKEFMDLWNDEEVKYIITARGGEFLMEMLPYITNDLMNNPPKWIQGFSDSSLLLFYITTNFNIPTIHANNFSAYCMNKLHNSLIKSLDFVQSPFQNFTQTNFEMYEKYAVNREDGKELEEYNLTEKVIYRSLRKSSIEVLEGRLIGGCVDVLRVIVGTDYDKTKKFCNQFSEGMIWYLENCEMSVAELYRALWQMKNAGWFNNVNGFLFGRTRSDKPLDDFTYQDVLHAVFDDLNIPVIYDVDFGHVMPQFTLINGGKAKFFYENGCGKMEIKIN